MIPALIEREALVIARRHALAAAMLVHAAFLTLFVLAWGDGQGFTLLPAPSFYGQLRLVQWLLMTGLLPWTAARCMADEYGNDLVAFSVAASVSPARIVRARAVAVTLALLLVTLAGLPPALLAARMSDVTLPAVVVDELALSGAAIVTVATTLAVKLEVQRAAVDRPVVAWAISGTAIAVIFAAAWTALPLAVITAVALLTLGAMGAIVASRRAESRFVYLAERTPS